MIPVLPVWMYAALAVVGVVLVWVAYIVISQAFTAVVAVVVVGLIVYLLYQAWVSGKLEEFISRARQEPLRYVPFALVIVFLGAYFAYYAVRIPFVDMSMVFSYKLVGGEGIGGALFGAKIDENSINYQVSVVRAYYELPFLVKTETNPEAEESVGPGAYLEVYVPETGERYYMPFRYVNLITRYLGGGEGTDMFTIIGLPLSPDVENHAVVLRVYQDGRVIWERRVLIASGSPVNLVSSWQAQSGGVVS